MSAYPAAIRAHIVYQCDCCGATIPTSTGACIRCGNPIDAWQASSLRPMPVTPQAANEPPPVPIPSVFPSASRSIRVRIPPTYTILGRTLVHDCGCAQEFPLYLMLQCPRCDDP